MPIRILPHDVTSAYHAVADVYDTVFRSRDAVDKQVQCTRALLEGIKAKRVIDVAAGTGTEALPVWRDCGLELLVVNDANSSMLGRLRERASYSGVSYRDGWASDANGLVVMQTDWGTLDSQLPPDTFDAVICTGLSFYQCYTTESFVSALRCWHRLLKVGGVVLVDFLNQDAECDKVRREGCATAEDPEWRCAEVVSNSERRYVVTDFHATLPLDKSPIGWQTWNTWIVAELDEMRRAMNLRTLSGGGAMLDASAVQDLAEQAGGFAVDNAFFRETPQLDVPASHEVLSMHRTVLRKVSY